MSYWLLVTQFCSVALLHLHTCKRTTLFIVHHYFYTFFWPCCVCWGQRVYCNMLGMVCFVWCIFIYTLFPENIVLQLKHCINVHSDSVPLKLDLEVQLVADYTVYYTFKDRCRVCPRDNITEIWEWDSKLRFNDSRFWIELNVFSFNINNSKIFYKTTHTQYCCASFLVHICAVSFSDPPTVGSRWLP